MTPSLIYRSSVLYEMAMVALYRQHYGARYEAVAGLIPAGATVLELCCGPAVLYWRYLRQKNVTYRGLDLSERFVRKLSGRGVAAEVWDLRSNRPLPSADYVVMQASLYHFLPDASPIVDRMLEAAGRQVVVAEPIRNLASAKLPIVRYAAGLLTDPGVGPQATRFTEDTLDELAASYGPRLRRSFLAAGGREKIYVFGN
jgi:Methionine biosynthesis protein MetW